MAKSRRGEIYEFVAERCPPAPLPSNWPLPIEIKGLLEGHPEPAALMAELLEEYSPADLLSSGVAVATDADNIQLNPELGPTGSGVVPLRRSSKSAPDELIVDSGLISGDETDLLAGLRDFGGKHGGGAPRAILLTFGAANFASLGSLGLAVAPAAGLASLKGERLTSFCQTFRLKAPRRMEPRDALYSCPPTVPVLVGWSPAQWEAAAPAQLAAVELHLGQLHECLGIDLAPVKCWRPDGTELEKLRFTGCIGDLADLTNSIVSACLEAESIIPSAAEPALISALHKWQTATSGKTDPQTMGRVQDEVASVFQSELIDPLLEVADSMTDPVRRFSTTLFAQLCRSANRAWLVLDLQMRRGARTPVWNARGGGRANLNRLLALVDRAMSLAHELTRRSAK